MKSFTTIVLVWLFYIAKCNKEFKIILDVCNNNYSNCLINPSTTTRVKISQNFDTSQGLSSALKTWTLSNLTCSKYIYRSKWVNCFCLVKALSCIVQGCQNDSKKAVKNAPVYTFGSTVKNRQLTGFDLYSNFHLKCSNSRKVLTQSNQVYTMLTEFESSLIQWS